MDVVVETGEGSVVRGAVVRAAERYGAALCGDESATRFDDILKQPMPPILLRVLRSVEETYWRREMKRRTDDQRFEYADSGVAGAAAAFDKNLRLAMVVTRREIVQLAERALGIQTEAIVSAVQCMDENFYSRDNDATVRTSIIVATRLGLPERFVRALKAMAEGAGEDYAMSLSTFARIVRDVEAKEFAGSGDLLALDVLQNLLLIYALRTEDDKGIAPVDLVLEITSKLGTESGAKVVAELSAGKTRVSMEEVEALFISEMPEDTEPAESTEEVSRFLDDIGVDADQMGAEGATGSGNGGVRFILTDEEKLAYVSKAVGHYPHLIDPIMKTVDGALTWEEVDRAIQEMVPDDATATKSREFRSRIRDR
jgi:hypothetical protein